MFGPAGHLYVYFSYGNHWCMNVTCGPGEAANAVLFRAAAPVAGLELMRERREKTPLVKALRDRDLAAGPGRLGQAFAVDRADNGMSLISGPLRISTTEHPRPRAPVSPRASGSGSAKAKTSRTASTSLTTPTSPAPHATNPKPCHQMAVKLLP